MSLKLIMPGKKATKVFMLLFMLCILTMAVSLPVYTKAAGSEDVVIEFDALAGTLKNISTGGKANKPFTVKKGGNLTFRVSNINLSAYLVTIMGELSQHNTDAPAQFSITGSPPTAGKDEKEESVTIGERMDALGIQAKSTGFNLEAALKSLEDSINRLKDIKKFRDRLKTILYDAESFAHLEILKNRLFIEFLDIRSSTAAPSTREVIDECNLIMNTANSKLQQIETVIEGQHYPGNRENFLRAIGEGELLKDLFELFKRYSQLEALTREFADEKYVAQIKEALDHLSPANFSISLTIPTVEADEVRFSVTIKPVAEKRSNVRHQLKNPVVVRVRGGWKIDFSMGVFFHVNAHDRTYWFDKVAGDESRGILRGRDDKYSITPVVGALMHVYPRQTARVKWSGLAFGLGTGEADKLSYYLGTGVMFGEKNRFLFNIGAAAVRFNALAPRYKDKPDKEIKRPGEEDSLVKPVYRLRLFVSLTYNL